jgi:hypothetical protein
MSRLHHLPTTIPISRMSTTTCLIAEMLKRILTKIDCADLS